MEFHANFNYISIDNFIKKTLGKTSYSNSRELKRSLEEFKNRKLEGEVCNCGNEIWIIGSAYTGKGCFTCITRETNCSGDYEIE